MQGKIKNLEVVTLKKPGITDFAKERSLILKKTKAKWVFFVDSDEVVTNELHNEVIKQVQMGKYDGFYVNRKNYFLGQYVGEDKIIRLGKKNLGKWQRAVHETWNIKGEIGELKYPLIHNTADNLHGYITKINKYSAIHAEENRREGKKSNIIKIMFFPIGKFIQTFIKSRNVVFSIMQSLHSFLAWSNIWIFQNA